MEAPTRPDPCLAVIAPDAVKAEPLAQRAASLLGECGMVYHATMADAVADAASSSAIMWLALVDTPEQLAAFPGFADFDNIDGPPVLLALHPPAWPQKTREQAFAKGALMCLRNDCSDAELRGACQSAWCIWQTRGRLQAASSNLGELAGLRSRELYEVRESLRATLDFTSDLVFVIRTQPGDFPIMECSASASRALREYDGIPPGTPLARYLTPGSFQVLDSMLTRLSGRLQDAFDLEFRARNADPIPVTVVARTMQRPAGAEVMLVCRVLNNSDVSGPQRLEGYQDLQLMAARTGMITYEVDVRENAIVFGGALQELTGFSVKEFEAYQGGRWMVLIHPDDRAAVMDQFNAAVAAVGKYELHYRIRVKTGRYRHVEDTGVCIPGNDGRAARVLGTVRDVSHRIEQEQAYRKAEAIRLHSQKLESLGVLAGGIAHDFNNILAAIIGLTSLALRTVEEDTELHSDLSEVLNAGNRARDLVRQILTFSRQGDTERASIDLRQIVAEAVRLVRVGLPSNIRLEVYEDRADGHVLANPAQMHQVVLNFCTNAVHAMREKGGVLRIVLKQCGPEEMNTTAHPRLGKGPCMCLTVSDTGHGMTPNVIERIFDPFFTTKGPGEGTGMGLAVVHGIVALHGGVIDVRSEPGGGTSFFTYFPLLDEPKPEEPPADTPAPEGKERITVVRTDEVIGAFVAATLRHQGYAVHDVRGLEAALEYLTDDPITLADLIVVDAGMRYPGIEDFIATIRERADSLPIILLEDSGAGEFGDAPPENVTFAEKPLTFEQLARAIRVALDQGGSPAGEPTPKVEISPRIKKPMTR